MSNDGYEKLYRHLDILNIKFHLIERLINPENLPRLTTRSAEILLYLFPCGNENLTTEMCITFFRINNSDCHGPYRLILIANRDEFYHRKSKPADYWENEPDVLGGLDLSLEPHGTWLAASKEGKLGVLLNIQEGKANSSESQSRGLLISNYVKQDYRAEDYIQNILKDGNVYNGYHLLLFTLTAEVVKLRTLTYLQRGIKIEINEFKDGDYGISNSPICTPYQKVLFGKQKFGQIVNQFNTLEQKETLVAELKKLLQSQVRNYPDDVLYTSKKDFMPSALIEKLSSVHVNMPEEDYGTRTHTIILVDWNNRMDFREYTMTDRDDNGVMQWDDQKFEVELDIEERN